MTERDAYEEWTYRGQKRCYIHKNDIGNWCGYTQTSLRGFTETDLYDHGGHEGVRILDIHGGLTYGPDEEGWVGFDCAHSRDLCLDENGEPWGSMGEDNLNLRRYGSVEDCREQDDVFVWEIDDVKEEVERLADQLICLEQFVGSLE